ncbi:hypothetical protein H2200_005568 [Cladophialophora chaetospira]|uniref:Reticulon-like protein n=1 Tax=Cladophialophora chaetospira TaxID=386627 RepID=A0AA38XCE1_9EURO|nr:hypothetical protein H2200_005568 [Cladophialophora chaetospira]
MSGPDFVVMPVSEDGGQNRNQHTAKTVSTIQGALHKQNYPEQYREPERRGPLKGIIDNKDSLYNYISWEDPTRTAGAYFGSLTILFLAHYLPLTQTALKAGITTLGVVSITEFASRQFGPNSLSKRMRPQEYKKVPEPILNDTLKDVHDGIQFAVVQAQKIFFAQDLERTIAVLVGLVALYGLIQFVPAFWLAVIGLTSIFVAPLAYSPRARAAAQDAAKQAQALANTAAQKGQELAQTGQAKASELTSRAQEGAQNASGRAQELAQSGKESVQQSASNASGQIQNLAQSGKQTAVDQSARARDATSNAANNASNTVSSAAENTRQTVNNTLPDRNGGYSNGYNDDSQSYTDGAANKASQISNSATDTVKQYTPSSVADNVNYLADKAHRKSVGQGNDSIYQQGSGYQTDSSYGQGSSYQPNSSYQQGSDQYSNGASALPSQSDGGSHVTPRDNYAGARDAVGAHDMMSRPRGSFDG